GGPVRHARIIQQILAPDSANQAAPMFLIAPRGEYVAPIVEPAGGALVEVARRRSYDAIATTRQHIITPGLAAHCRATVVQHGIAHRNLNMLATARRDALIERSENSHGTQHARARIADGRAWSDGRAVRMAIHAHRATHCLRNHVEGQIIRVWTFRRETLDLGENQTRIDAAELRIVESQSREGAWCHVL